jgi:hypothetical protein
VAYLENSINGNQFASLTGAIHYAKEQLEVIERAGVDGTGLRRLGSRSEPSQLVSVTYCATFTAAATLVNVTYKALIGANPVTVIRNGFTHGNFAVKSVREVRTYAVVNPTGNVPGGAGVCLVCEWELL